MSEAMKPGRKLDALVAEKVMGLEVVTTVERYLEVQAEGGDFFGKKYVCLVLAHNESFAKHRPGNTIAIVPGYSTDIAAVWEVVEQMGAKEILGVLTLGAPCDDNPKWRAIFTKKWVANLDAYPDGIEHGDSAPHAICLAALKATGHDPYDPEVLQQGHT